MKAAFILFPRRKRLLLFAGISSLLIATGRLAPGEPANAASGALAAAKAWVAQIDAGEYAESYHVGCDEFHHKVTQEKWTLVLKAFRPSFGEVVSRKVVSDVYQPDGVNGLDGECRVITFDTSFSRLQDGYERVILKLEDGKWRGAAYVAGPKNTDQSADDQPAPQVETEVQTMKTQHPPQ